MPRQLKKTKILGIFTLSMINVAAVASIRGLPTTAEYGLSAVFLYVAAAIVFFIPVALVSAELATTFPCRGGVYTWIKKAFGGEWGFLGIWLQWMQNIFYYPAVLSFVAATIAYAINPALATNKIYMASVIIGVYWLFTLVNFFGMKVSGFISSLFVIVGTIIPVGLLIALSILWVIQGHPVHFNTHLSSMVPSFTDINQVVFFISVILAFAGMEMSAVHAQEVKNPQRDYPRAILLSVFVILLLFILGSLAISTVIPKDHISLVAGIMQAFNYFLNSYHLKFLTPVMAILITIGAVGSVNTWIAGPSKGLMWTAHDGDIPPLFQHINKFHMPVVILIFQGILVTILALLFLLMPTVNSSFWILSTITVQMYLVMYLILFAAAICLRYKFPGAHRPYRVPLGNFGMWVVAGIGILGSLFAFTIGFFPPAQIKTGSVLGYEAFLVGGLFIMIVLPIMIYSFRQPSWQDKRPVAEADE